MSTLPATMRFVGQRETGGPEVLQIEEGALPSAGPGEVLIRVMAAGVNRPDCFQRAGFYPPPPGASPIIGLEVAGTIAAVGKEVTDWQVGHSCCALVTGGGYAEYCVAPQETLLPIPEGMGFTEAATLPETFFTVWSNVFQRGQLSNQETFLVQGGSSGIGSTAIQLVSALGHRVFATAGSPEKCAFCETLGAERAVNYRQEDFVAVIKSLTDQRGVDVILDMVVGDYLPRELKLLKDGGRLVIIAFLGGSKVQVDFAEVMRRRLTITGSTLRARELEFKKRVRDELLNHAWPLLSQGRINTHIYQQFTLDNAAKAHAVMESGRHMGKLVLTVA
ncbi:phthiocerol synthesis polyketide synthase type I PpsC [Ferrovum sp. JA12]|uniref:NAD(P)H-quinone oxidoreductase n=2 Tax=Ferrovum sp. JA12 TaxID=1356299 RepID=UPI000712DFF4|nr:NAD(P)H-quinone oxidoreductase [Ferrovum sp. JA12]KRH78305.1 phthiocerol synthesis polyketide synthase type I PpsC [Ferrovum sp. JA12]